MRLSHSDYAQLLDFIAELQTPVPARDFGAHVVEMTGKLFPGGTVSFDQINENAGQYLLNHNSPLTIDEQLTIAEALRRTYRSHPLYSLIKRGRVDRVVDLADVVPAAVFHRTDFYQEVFRPYDLHHQASVHLSRGDWITGLMINQERAFPARTKTMLALAARHIVAAHRTAELLEQLPVVERQQPTGGASLTVREMQVVEWLRVGKRNCEIALILGCSSRTIDKHVENILRKTGAETRTGAVWQIGPELGKPPT